MRQAEPSSNRAGAESSTPAIAQDGAITEPSKLPVSFRTPATTALRVLLPILIYAALVISRVYRSHSIFEASLSGLIFLSVLLGAYLVLLMARIPLSITVLDDAIEIHYALWRRRVPYPAISNVSLIRARNPKNRKKGRVRVDLRNFLTFNVANLRNGSLTLYDTICWARSPAAAGSERAAALTSEPLTKLSTPYVAPWRVDPSMRRFPQWLAPAILGVAAIAALAAPHDIWRNLRTTRPSPPDTKTLATFPQVATGWAGVPVPLFHGEALGSRWNVDFKTGAFTHSQTDFYIGDSIPINITRVFLNREAEGALGGGTGISYDIHPVGDAVKFTYMIIVTPAGENFHFTRTSPGTSWKNAVYRADDIRGAGGNPFAGATISWNGSGWTLLMMDGTLMKFPAVHGQVSEGQEGLLSIADGKGNVLRIARDRQGNILKVTSPHGAFVTFKHDIYNRITSATDYRGKTIVYDYDEHGRLIRVDDPTEGITHYVYGQNGSLLKIVKPDGSTWIKVDYDDRGRVAEMRFADGSSCRYEYQTDAQGMITMVKVIPSNGPPRRVSLNGASGASQVGADRSN
jgi:YD repeat-containing protein